ncbi:MAG: aminotransferase class V-fold PLP-dependent enzyme, partial [Anaerolineae bacterium]|nr:aminotransferase class V-fold PLP-dependent enzyme [Anaerolineae bacterium]
MVTLPTHQKRYPADQMDTAYAAFLEQYPQYRQTAHIDTLRAAEYSRLDKHGHIYLDYTGGGLYGDSQLEQHNRLLREGVFGNPHSSNPTSQAMTNLDEHARDFVLEYFNADPAEYVVIFTQNASGALKLVGEAYPFEDNGQYLLTFDNHNSVNGIREFAKKRHAPVTYSPVLPPDLRIDEAALRANLDKAIPGGNNLFGYPAQSNFSGVQHPLEWI